MNNQEKNGKWSLLLKGLIKVPIFLILALELILCIRIIGLALTIITSAVQQRPPISYLLFGLDVLVLAFLITLILQTPRILRTATNLTVVLIEKQREWPRKETERKERETEGIPQFQDEKEKSKDMKDRKMTEFLKSAEEKLKKAKLHQKKGEVGLAHKFFAASKGDYNKAYMHKPTCMPAASLGGAECQEGRGKTAQEGKNFYYLTDALNKYKETIEVCETIIVEETNDELRITAQSCHDRAGELRANLIKYLEEKYAEKYKEYMENGCIS